MAQQISEHTVQTMQQDLPVKMEIFCQVQVPASVSDKAQMETLGQIQSPDQRPNENPTAEVFNHTC